MQKIEITIKGVAPLLQHRFPEATAQELVNPVKITKASKPTPEQDAEASAIGDRGMAGMRLQSSSRSNDQEWHGRAVLGTAWWGKAW